MLKSNLICLSLFLLTQIVPIKPAQAQINCEDPQNASEANSCLENSDKELNETYQLLISNLSTQNRRKLIEAEQAWIKFRDAHCTFRVREFGLDTSMGRQFYSSCLDRLTRDRTLQLRRELEQ